MKIWRGEAQHPHDSIGNHDFKSHREISYRQDDTALVNAEVTGSFTCRHVSGKRRGTAPPTRPRITVKHMRGAAQCFRGRVVAPGT